MVEIALGLGIVLSLVLTETLGVTAGGLIVPGYIALYLHDPLRVIGTFAVSLIVFGIVRLLSFRMLIFGFEVGSFVFSIQHLYVLVEMYPLCNGWYGINLTSNQFNFNKIYLL